MSGLGVLLTGGPGPPAGWADAPGAFAALEEAGCGAIWLADHLFWGSPMPEALTMAAVAASATSRCLVGPGVLQLPLRRVAAVARAATTISHLAPGRFVLGLGSGEHDAEYRLAGAAFTQRGADLDRGIDELRRLWRDTDDWYAQRPAPGSLPIWVGGRSSAAIQRAATRADGWMPIFVTPESFGAANRALDDRLEAGGRPGDAVVRAAIALAAVTDESWTRDDALGWAGHLWRIDPDRLDRYLITGSPERCAAALVELRDAGAAHVAVLPATDDPIAATATLAAAFAALDPPASDPPAPDPPSSRSVALSS